jgi:hypothetical protein
MLTLAEIEALPFEPEAKDVGYVYEMSLLGKVTYIGQHYVDDGKKPLEDGYVGSGSLLRLYYDSAPEMSSFWRKTILATARDQDTLDQLEEFHIASSRKASAPIREVRELDESLGEEASLIEYGSINVNIKDGATGPTNWFERERVHYEGVVEVRHVWHPASRKHEKGEKKVSAHKTEDVIVWESQQACSRALGLSQINLSAKCKYNYNKITDGDDLGMKRRKMGGMNIANNFIHLATADSLAVLFHVALASNDPELLSFVAPYLVDSDGRDYRSGRLSPTTPLPLAA